jgi:hypothetical protein
MATRIKVTGYINVDDPEMQGSLDLDHPSGLTNEAYEALMGGSLISIQDLDDLDTSVEKG